MKSGSRLPLVLFSNQTFVSDKRKKLEGWGRAQFCHQVFSFAYLPCHYLFCFFAVQITNHLPGGWAQPFCALQSWLCLLRENWFCGMLCVHILIWALQPTPAEQVNPILSNGPQRHHSSLASYYSLIATCQTGRLKLLGQVQTRACSHEILNIQPLTPVQAHK